MSVIGSDRDLDRAERLGAETSVREIPARHLVSECDEQLDKLTALVAQLEDRLDWVRSRRPDAPERPNEQPKTIQSASVLVTDLRRHVDAVKRLQERLSVLLAELEV